MVGFRGFEFLKSHAQIVQLLLETLIMQPLLVQLLSKQRAAGLPVFQNSYFFPQIFRSLDQIFKVIFELTEAFHH